MSMFSGEKVHIAQRVSCRANGVDNPLEVQNESGTSVFLVDHNGAVTSAGAQTLSAGATVATGQTLAVTSADKLTVGGLIVPQELEFSQVILAATANQHVFVAPWTLQITGIQEIHSVVGGSGATVAIRKITDTSAPNASAGATVKELMTGALSLTSTANTVQSGTLSATATDLQFAIGDHIAINFAGTLTGLVGVVTIKYKRI